MNQKGEYVVWFTGLSGSGKTTIAKGLALELKKRKKPFVMLDDDKVRKTLSSDLGYTKYDRNKHIVRVANMCYIISANNIMSIACVLSPIRRIRKYARDLVGRKYFVEVYVKCPIEVCEERDVKGYWTKARKGFMKNFVGIDVPYEEPLFPTFPEVILNTDKEKVSESINKIVKYLEKIKAI